MKNVEIRINYDKIMFCKIRILYTNFSKNINEMMKGRKK